MNDLLTVAEVAEALGKTDRAIYKQIAEGKLSEYLVLDGGRKYLKKEVLTESRIKKQVQKISTGSISDLNDSEQILEKLNEISEKLSLILDRLPEKPIEIQREAAPLPPAEPVNEPERTSFFSRLFRK